MAYIQPDGIVEFFPELGLSPNYENAMFFDTVANKDLYFSNLPKIATAQALTYTREARGYIRVEKPISLLYRAGYMRYKNSSFENKWFYAFVKSVEYINNITTQVNFEIDVMMTWMGNFIFNECFIERQHTIGDEIGANICDENLETGEYICQASSTTAFFGQYTICIFQSEDANGQAAGVYYGGIYSGLYMYIATSAASATSHIQAMITANKADSIVMILMLPTHFLPDNIMGSDTPTEDTFSVTKPYTSLNGYIPKNKKLFVYPYNFLTVYNTEGESADYQYEYFNTLPDATSTGEAYFKIYGSCNIQTEIACVPQNYKGVPFAYAEKLSITNFPKCSWNVDAFKAYLAQAQSSLSVGLVSSALRAGVGATIGNPIMTAEATGEGIGNIANLMVTKAVHPSMPIHSKGQQTNDLFVGLKAKNFYFYQMCITKNYAQMIDNYFDMFGYAVRQHGIPNMNARPNWTYIKTLGCSIHGEIPADDAAKIEKIFDTGVRFWKDHNKIGHYSDYSNAPV